VQTHTHTHIHTHGITIVFSDRLYWELSLKSRKQFFLLKEKAWRLDCVYSLVLKIILFSSFFLLDSEVDLLYFWVFSNILIVKAVALEKDWDREERWWIRVECVQTSPGCRMEDLSGIAFILRNKIWKMILFYFYFYFFKRWGLTMFPGLALVLPGWSSPSASVSPVARTISVCTMLSW
jgi:hypothetical protein